jgi:uncharacterized protein YjcR
MSDITEANRILADADLEEWLTVRMIATRLSVSTKQVRKWIGAGQFDEIAVFSPRITRVSVAAYRRFVEKNIAA